MSIDFMELNKEQNVNLTIKNNNNDQNELVKKKKKQLNLPPTIRFNIEIEKPSSDHFTECNYNTLVLKTLKYMHKKIKNDDNTKKKRVTQNELSIIDKEFCIENEKIPRLISMFRKKIALNKHLNDGDLEINENEKSVNIDDSMDKDENEKDDSENEVIDIDDETDDDEDDEDNDDDHNDEDDADNDDDEDDGDDDDDDESDNDYEDEDESNLEEDSHDNSYDIENKRLKLQNFAHLGIGYDDNDSFIDNSEVIDERLPSNMVPKHGGFYINKAQQVKLVNKQAHSKVSSKQTNNKRINIDSVKSDDDNSNIEAKKNNKKKNARKLPISDDESTEKDASNNNNHANGELCAKKKKLEPNIMDTNNKAQFKTEPIETNDKKQVKRVIAIPININNKTSNNNNNNNNNNTNQIKLIESSIKKIEHIDDGSTTSKDSKYDDEPIEQTNENKNLNLAASQQISAQVLNNLSVELKNLILYIEKLYIDKKLKNEDFWSQNARNILLKIYINTRDSTSNEKSQIFSYLASKLDISKSALLKRCKRLYSKETSSETNANSTQQQQQSQQQQQQQTPPQQQNRQQTQLQKPQSQQHQYQKQQQQPIVAQSASKTLSTSPKTVYNLLEDSQLENTLKEKITNLLQTYKQFRLINGDNSEYTFEINNHLFSIDSQARKLYNNQQERLNKIYDFIAYNLSIQRDAFNRKLIRIRNDFMEKQLQSLINKFKNELDKEMKIQTEKHNQSYAEFMKKLTIEQQTGVNGSTGEQKKKIFGPRKKFQWSNELRDQLKRIINLKISLLNLKDNSHNNNLELLYENIKIFLLNSLLNLWPDGWMQINTLINECSTFIPQIHQYKQQYTVNKASIIQQLQTQQPQQQHQNLKQSNQQQSTKKPIQLQQQQQQQQHIQVMQKQNNNSSQNQSKLMNVDQKQQKQIHENSKSTNFIQPQTSPVNSIKSIQQINSTQISQQIYKQQVQIGQNKTSNNQIKSPSQSQVQSSKSTSSSPNQVQSASNLSFISNNSNSSLKTSSNNTASLIAPNFPFTSYHNPWSALSTLNYQQTNLSIDTLNTLFNELVKKNTTDPSANLNKN